MSVLSLANLFSDHMVLQRGQDVPVWGTATPGAAVTVECQGRRASAIADAAGRFRAILPPLNPGGPFMLVASAGAERVERQDVLVGDVWVCGGQSNMEHPLARVPDAEAWLDGSYPGLRLLRVPMRAANEPQSEQPAVWRPADRETLKPFSAVGFFFGRALGRALGVPIGLIQSCVGGTKVESWLRREVAEADPELAFILADYQRAVDRLPEATQECEVARAAYAQRAAEARQRGEAPPPPGPIVNFGPMGPAHPKRPFAHYNAMIAPLLPGAIRGAIWYQGESDTNIPERYAHLFTSMVANWRRDWAQGDFPFLFVQLPGYAKPGQKPWAWQREAQQRALALEPNLGMAVTIDVGEPFDIHPRYKQPVGDRLALAARAMAFGHAVAVAGPVHRDTTFADGRAVARFDTGGAGLAVGRGPIPGGPPRDAAADTRLRGFALAGADRRFVEAEARLEGDAVIVRHPDLAAPVALRYAFENFPECNLYDRLGLPAAPFRTDDWPIETF